MPAIVGIVVSNGRFYDQYGRFYAQNGLDMCLENQPYGGDIDQKIDGGNAWESGGDAGDFIEPADADSGSGVYRRNPVVCADFSENDANYAKFGDFHDGDFS